RADRNCRALGDQPLAQHAFAARGELHHGLVGFDFGEDVAALDGVALVLEPLHEAAFFHRGAQGLHEHFRRHRQASMYMTFFTAAIVFGRSGFADFSSAFAYGIGVSAWCTRITGASRWSKQSRWM